MICFRRDVKPRGNVFLEVVPSFSGMVFRCGEGYVLEAYSSSSCFVLNRIQKGRQAPGQRVFGRRSVLQWHGVSVWPRVRFGGLQHHLQQHHQQQQEQQQQQAQQLNSLCFYQKPEGTSSPGTACFWRSFRPSGPWCFAVSESPAGTSLWSCFEGMGAALWS